MKKYIEPEIKLYEFLKADVIRTSGYNPSNDFDDNSEDYSNWYGKN